MNYKLIRTCKDCNNEDSFTLTKVEVAFEQYNFNSIWESPCTICKSMNCSSISNPMIKVDRELLDLWGNDSNLHFMEQDEEIILAEIDYFPMILQAIDKEIYLRNKTNILIDAACVLLYEYTNYQDEYSQKENEIRKITARKIREELIKRKDKISRAEDVIMGYIKDNVFPQIGL